MVKAYAPVEYQALHAAQAAVLGLSDGAHSLDDLAAEVAATLHIPRREGRRRVRTILHQYAHAVIAAAPSGPRRPVPILEFASSEADRDTVIPAAGGQLSAPLRLCIAIWPHCDQSCRHCHITRYARAHAADPPMSVERIEDLFLEARGLGCLAVLLGGGDPLLHPRILEIVRLAVASGLGCSISTRSRPDERQCAELAAVGIRWVAMDSLKIDPARPREENPTCVVVAGPPPTASALHKGLRVGHHWCPGGREELFIVWQGKSYLCERIAHLPGMEVGDLRHESLLEVWQGVRLGRLLGRGMAFSREAPCAECVHFAACALPEG
jgi:radical SAM protein with 4Fe4S-binding SPASM domain